MLRPGGRSVDSPAQYPRSLNLRQLATLKFPMLSGQHLSLLIETLGIETIGEENRVAVMVPAGETVTVLSGPRPDDMRMVDVQWGDKKLVMFYEDIQKGGESVKSKRA